MASMGNQYMLRMLSADLRDMMPVGRNGVMDDDDPGVFANTRSNVVIDKFDLSCVM